MSLTGPVEDYLKAIYEIEQDGNAAATTTIAQRLSIAPASVSGMLRRLAEQHFVEHEPYHGVRLTPLGRRAALRTLRRHRVLEAYLTGALGYPWDRVHEEAERLEHAASDELVDRMAAAIGEPAVDPHGAPIPTREGRVDESRHRSLADLALDETAVVSRVSDEDGEMLRYLATLGLRPGVSVCLLRLAPFGGPLTVSVDGREQSVGPALAAQVRIVSGPEHARARSAPVARTTPPRGSRRTRGA